MNEIITIIGKNRSGAPVYMTPIILANKDKNCPIADR